MLLLAHLLPLALGTGLYAACIEPSRRGGDWLRALGYGYLIGLAVIVLAIAVLRPAPAGAAMAIGPWLALLTIAAWVLPLRWRRWQPPRVTTLASPEPAWGRWLLLALAVWLLWRGWRLGVEVGLRDVFPWDAWTTWSVKAKTWYLRDALLPFVSFYQWLENPDSRHLAAWFYPSAIPWLELWFASAHGAWNEPAVHTLWPALWLAGTAILVGQLRALGSPWWLAILAGYAWASLPLIETHVALAGYADMPLTVCFGAAALALGRFAAGHGWRHAALALALTLMLPGFKQEGVLWLLVLGFGLAHALLPAGRRNWIAAAAIVVALAWTLLIGVRLPLPSLGWVEMGWGYLRAPTSGVDMALAWRPVAGPVAESLLLAPNWHLLWWLSPPVLLLTLAVWRRHATLSWIALLSLALVLAVFFFTEAARWAENLTALNRVLMQLTLLWIGWLALLVSERLRARGTAPPAGRTPARSDSASGSALDPLPPAGGAEPDHRAA